MKRDWVECTLGDICFTTSGGTPSRANKSYFKGEIPWVKSGELDKGIIYDTEEHISQDALKKSSAKLFPKGTLLIALYGATIGKMALLGVEASTNQAICGIYKSEVIKTSYLYNYLLFKKNKLIGQGMGGAQPNISQTILKQLEVELPPLPIQRAIVAKIEELFSSLDSGIADLEKAQKQLVVYRQAVLKKAFEGHKEVQFEKIISSTQNGISKRKGEKGDLIKVLRLADIKNLKIDNTNPRKIQLNKDEENKYKLNAGDLIVIRVNGSINLVGRFIHVSKKDEIELWAFCDHFIRITLDLTKCHPIFYYYFFQLSKVRKFINYNMVSSAGQNTVSQTTVKSISVPLISLKEQNQIIREIESRLSVCDKVEESIAESLEKAKALRQSILKKAFEGKLLSEEEIAKCKREKDYEPAYKLLERIRGEKKQKK